MDQDSLYRLRKKLDLRERELLSPHACPSAQAIRREEDPLADKGSRQQFQIDSDRVLHSLAYTRYIDKTQVFSLIENDHITHRVLHVQLVSKIARAVGRLLGLNEDLIEAISLAHDIGHAPFGHDGERFLSEVCQENGGKPFLHNVQSMHFVDRVEKGGRGLNLSLQVLDGILCHDGEVHAYSLSPERAKTFAELDSQALAKLDDPKLSLAPMTLEGCVVRFADTMAYIGRDLEDAILLGLVKREQLPGEVCDVLGNTNGTIVYRLVEDLVAGSLGKDKVAFSAGVGRAQKHLKEFNYREIYLNPVVKAHQNQLRMAYRTMFRHFLGELRANKRQSLVYTDFLDTMRDDTYRQAYGEVEIVRDFIAAMTDDYFLRVYGSLVMPQPLPTSFS